jgi:uncharacterized metal-binding protein (TIGR02443 family)
MVKRRFIAGAVCPKCGRMDRIVVAEACGESSRLCVSCGFNDATKLGAGPVPKSRLIRTNPDAKTPRKVRIIDRDD